MPEFSTITAEVAARIIAQDRARICALVRDAYRDFGAKRAINPHSSFLTFSAIVGRSADRIIALPACLYGEQRVAGMKWISSFPGNTRSNLPRASAVIVLNDLETGFPFVCMEGSVISAARTAASAVIGAEILCGTDRAPPTVGFIGNGIIAATICDFLSDMGWRFGAIRLFDRNPAQAQSFRSRTRRSYEGPIHIEGSAADVLAAADLLVLATTAATPHIHDPTLFARYPKILHISLRDLAPQIILESDNIVDDTEHCLRANTSLHLAEQLSGSRQFVTANIYDCLAGGRHSQWHATPGRTAIFSPFGMGVLDLAVGLHVYEAAARGGTLRKLDDFFLPAEALWEGVRVASGRKE